MYRRRSNDKSLLFSLSGGRTGGRGSTARNRGGAGHGDYLSGLNRSFERLSVAPRSNIVVPPLTRFVFRSDAATTESWDSDDEAVPEATSIPNNYASTQDYLKVLEELTLAYVKLEPISFRTLTVMNRVCIPLHRV